MSKNNSMFSVSPSSYLRIGMSVRCAFLSDDDATMSWFDGVVTKVVKRGVSYADCNIQYDDGDRTTKQRFRNSDYHAETTPPSADAWKFGVTSVNMLINELVNERSKTHDLTRLLHSYQEANSECATGSKRKRVDGDGLVCFELKYVSAEDFESTSDYDNDEDDTSDDSDDEDYTSDDDSESATEEECTDDEPSESPDEDACDVADAHPVQCRYITVMRRVNMLILLVFIMCAFKMLVRVSPCQQLIPTKPCIMIETCPSWLGRVIMKLMTPLGYFSSSANALPAM